MKSKIKKRKKGFTLIELIVVISIMGIILLLSFPLLRTLQANNTKREYNVYYNSVIKASKVYTSNYERDMFPNVKYGCFKITYDNLKNSNLIKDIEKDGVTCKNDNTYVIVTKSNQKYTYYYSIKCTKSSNSSIVLYQKSQGSVDSECKYAPEASGPTLTIKTNSLNVWRNSSGIKVNVEIAAKNGLESNVGIRYYWEEISTGVKKAENTYYFNNKRGVEFLSYKIPNKPSSGKYKLVVSPINKDEGIKDVAGMAFKTDVIKYPFLIDDIPPTCGTVSGASTIWSRSTRTINVACSDEHSRCKQGSFSKTFKESIKRGAVVIRDNAGNTTNCGVNVYVDSEPPVCGKVTGQSTKWTNGSRNITVECDDDVSGCVKTVYSENFDSGTTRTSNFIIQDNAGNSATCPFDVYVDKDGPRCGTAENSKYNWTNVTNSIYQYCDDNIGSGCRSSVYSTSYSNADYGGTYIYDKVGNETYCTYPVFIDTTPPYTPYSSSISPFCDPARYCSAYVDRSYGVSRYSNSQIYFHVRVNSYCTLGPYGYDCSVGFGSYKNFVLDDNFGVRDNYFSSVEVGPGCTGRFKEWMPESAGIRKERNCEDQYVKEQYKSVDYAGNESRNYLVVEYDTHFYR